MTIREELLSLLICPETGAALSGWDGASEQGALTTSDGRSYPVTDGIPNLLPDTLRGGPADDTEVAEKRSEMQARDAQVKSYDSMLGLKLFTYYEVPLTLKFLPLEPSHLPARSEAFDRVGSFGVYEHIPTPEARDGALKHLARACKSANDGGRLALSAYRWGPPISWTSQREGHHPGGIYFVRLTQSELKAHCAPHFTVHEATEALLYYHLIWGQKDNHG